MLRSTKTAENGCVNQATQTLVELGARRVRYTRICRKSEVASAGMDGSMWL
jgi:hypothetical protein